MLVDKDHKHKKLLKQDEYKSLQTDRVNILVPGPPEEIETVNRIYMMFVDEGKTESDIADDLNKIGIKTDYRRL